MTIAQALYNFWSSFGVAAYDETSVPDADDLTFPYLTYETVDDEFGNAVALTTNLFYRSSSWKDITDKTAAIETEISRGGKLVKYDGGAFWIVKGTPFAQRMKDTRDEMVRVVIINVMIEFIK